MHTKVQTRPPLPPCPPKQMLLDDQLMKVGAMNASPFVKPFKEESHEWEATLRLLQVGVRRRARARAGGRARRVCSARAARVPWGGPAWCELCALLHLPSRAAACARARTHP